MLILTLIFDHRDLQPIISKGSLLNGTNVQTWFEQEDLPGNKTKFIYHLKGYVDFQWEQIMAKTKDQSYFDKMFEKLRKDLKEDIKKSENNIKAYVDVKVSECETNVKAYIDKKNWWSCKRLSLISFFIFNHNFFHYFR